jgi:transcriptional regulator with XRE-family HTH domain
MRKLALSIAFSLAAVALSFVTALASNIGPTP